MDCVHTCGPAQNSEDTSAHKKGKRKEMKRKRTKRYEKKFQSFKKMRIFACRLSFSCMLATKLEKVKYAHAIHDQISCAATRKRSGTSAAAVKLQGNVVFK